MSAFGVKRDGKSNKPDHKTIYCAACKKAGKADCETCNQNIKVIYS